VILPDGGISAESCGGCLEAEKAQQVGGGDAVGSSDLGDLAGELAAFGQLVGVSA